MSELNSWSLLLLTKLSAAHDPSQKDVSHLVRHGLGIGIDPGIVPGVNPIHHAEQAEYRDPRGELAPLFALQFIQQPDADSVILALDCGHFRGETILQRLSLV